MHQQQTAFENIVGKEEIACNNVFYSVRKLYPHLSVFMTSCLYLLLNWKSPKLACEVKG